MHLLICNDDGIHAPGIAALVGAALEAGHRVTVAAPEQERSGASSSITVHGEITLRERRDLHPGADRAWAVGGSPADCAKLALHLLGPGDRPNAVLSGVNRGQNTGTCVLYSGTCGAAFEGALLGLPSLAVSLGVLWPDAAEVRPGTDTEAPLISRHAPREEYAQMVREPGQYRFAAELAVRMVPGLVEAALPWGTLLNLNVPTGAGPDTPIEVGRMSGSYFVDLFEETSPGPDGTRRFRNVGDTLVHATGDEPWDDLALRRGVVSLVPVYFEMTGLDLMGQARRVAESAGAALATEAR
jgi:5'-nucleotidase